MILSKQFNKVIQNKQIQTNAGRDIITQFEDRLKQLQFSMEENPQSHFCSFFVPFDLSTKSVFMGHHIRADDWIPPGGHIDINESPLDAVKREFSEELNFQLSDEPIEPFSLSIITIDKSSKDRLCKIHYDFWYKVSISKRDFDFDKKEFYDAGWYKLTDVLKKVKTKEFLEVLKKFSSK